MSGLNHAPQANLIHTFGDEDEFIDRRGPHERKRRMLEVPVGLEFGPPPQAFMMLQVLLGVQQHIY